MAAHEHIPAYIRERGPMQLPVRRLHFASAIAMLKREPAWAHGNRLARTLAKEGPLAVVLSPMKAGASTQEHRAEGPITAQCLEGRLRLHAGGHPLDLVAGEMVVFDGGIPHLDEALTDCAVLLTMTQASADREQHA